MKLVALVVVAASTNIACPAAASTTASGSVVADRTTATADPDPVGSRLGSSAGVVERPPQRASAIVIHHARITS